MVRDNSGHGMRRRANVVVSGCGVAAHAKLFWRFRSRVQLTAERPAEVIGTADDRSITPRPRPRCWRWCWDRGHHNRIRTWATRDCWSRCHEDWRPHCQLQKLTAQVAHLLFEGFDSLRSFLESHRCLICSAMPSLTLNLTSSPTAIGPSSIWSMPSMCHNFPVESTIEPVASGENRSTVPLPVFLLVAISNNFKQLGQRGYANLGAETSKAQPTEHWTIARERCSRSAHDCR